MNKILKTILFWSTIIAVIIIATMIIFHNGRNKLPTTQMPDENWSNGQTINTDGVLELLTPTERVTATICAGLSLQNLKLVENHYALWNADNLTDRDIKLFSKQIKIYGIIKNSDANCVAKKIVMKVTITKDNEVMQDETFTIKDEDILPGTTLSLYPNHTAEYKHIFGVYESLLEAVRQGSFIKRYKLKSGLELQISIEKVDWDNPPDLDKIISDIKKKK